MIHGRNAIIYLFKYLKATRVQGIMLVPEFSKSFKVYSDANFCENWHIPTAGNYPSPANPRTGYVILYVSCLIIWCSKLQTHIALSTKEEEYINLLQSLRYAISMMQLLWEMKANGFPTISTSPEVHCRAFKDSIVAL